MLGLPGDHWGDTTPMRLEPNHIRH